MAFFHPVCDQNDFRVFTAYIFLDHLGDADAVIPQDFCHRCQHAAGILHLHTDKITVGGLVHCYHRKVSVAGAADPSAGTVDQIPDDVKHISHHRAGSGHFPGTPPVEHRITYRIPYHKYCVIAVIDGRRDGRFQSSLDALWLQSRNLSALATAQQLDVIPHLLRITDRPWPISSLIPSVYTSSNVTLE